MDTAQPWSPRNLIHREGPGAVGGGTDGSVGYGVATEEQRRWMIRAVPKGELKIRMMGYGRWDDHV